MDEQSVAHLKKIYASLKVLAETMHHNMAWSVHKGTGGVVVRSYDTLHAKVVQMFPDDTYITEGLAFNLPEDAPDSQQLGVANLLINQLIVYLRGLIPSEDEEQIEAVRLKRKLHKMMQEDQE